MEMTLPFLLSFTPPGIWVPALSYAMRGAQRGSESDLVPVLQGLLCLAGEENTKRRKDSAVWQGWYGRTHGSERAQRRKLLPSWAIQAGVLEEVAVPKKGERGLPAGAAACAKAGTGRSNRGLVQLKQGGVGGVWGGQEGGCSEITWPPGPAGGAGTSSFGRQ